MGSPNIDNSTKKPDMCALCATPSSLTVFLCGSCGSSTCYECAKKLGAASSSRDRPRCPGCGDSDRYADGLKQYLAAGEVLTSALDGVSKGYPVAQGVESMAQNIEPFAIVAAVPEVPHRASTAQHCHYCSAEGSMLDHTCPLCQTLVCTSCVSTHRSEDQRCPGCLDATSNERSMRLLLRSKEARSAASSLWSSITAFGAELWGCNNMPKTSKSWNNEEDHSAITAHPQTSIGRSIMKDDRGSDPSARRRWGGQPSDRRGVQTI